MSDRWPSGKYGKAPSWAEACPQVEPSPFRIVGRYRIVARTDGKWAQLDPSRPWNDCLVALHATEDHATRACQEAACVHPGVYEHD
jgi:hypothetical protein